MPAPLKQTGDFPNWLGMIYVFNLVVGSGILTLPNAFSKAGWLISPIIAVILCFSSYMTMTFMVESISLGNGYVQFKLIQENEMKVTEMSDDSQGHTITEEEFKTASPEAQSLVKSGGGVKRRFYHLDSKLEMGELVKLFCGTRAFKIVFYIFFATYMIGTSSLYVCVIAQTISDLICKSGAQNAEMCRDGGTITKFQVYRMIVLIFWVSVSPFTYFKLQATKYLQVFTLIVRWTALVCLVGYTFHLLNKRGMQGRPLPIQMKSIPHIIGSSIFCFMCHHSIPGLVYPFKNKHNMPVKLGIIVCFVFSFYMSLTIPGMLAFREVHPVYTLNLIGAEGEKDLASRIVCGFLVIFPIFPIITNYPIITITLQNNMKFLFFTQQEIDEKSFFFRRILFPTCACVPSVFIAFITNDIRTLVDIVMTYPGVCVQFIFPTVICYRARQKCREVFGTMENKYHSPFTNKLWFLYISTIAVCAMFFETFVIAKKLEKLTK